jgi:hypothetical protein
MRTFFLALLIGAAAQAAVPGNGTDEAPHRGNYVETSLGVFTAMGGSVPLSNAQPYISMAFGRELGAAATVFASLGIGAASASCYQPGPVVGGQTTCQAADSFGATFVEAGMTYGFPVFLRALLSLKVVAGLTDFSPGPVQDGSSVPNHLFGYHVGAGVAFDYDTHLDHFAIGADLLFRYSLARYTPAGGSAQTLGLPSAALMPRIRYVF